MDRRSFLQTTAAATLAGTAHGASADETDDTIPLVETDSRDMIWDLHCHFSGVPGPTIEDRTRQILEYADRMGVQRLVFFMGWPWSRNPQPDDFRRQNDQVLEALRKWPDRLFGFAYLSGHHPRESLQEIERCIANGPMIGIKLWVARRCSNEALDPIIARCGELKAAIYQHTWLKAQGNLEGESTPMDLALLAARHATVPIICGHTGGDWTRGIRAIRANKNVSIGIGGSEPTSGFVEMAVRELGPERVIYGSDAGGRSFSSQLAKVYGAEITDDAKRLILGQNLQRMLSPILRTKGIHT
jgi:predicted TIM-barrel fold metal-dependent hydrolase